MTTINMTNTIITSRTAALTHAAPSLLGKLLKLNLFIVIVAAALVSTPSYAKAPIYTSLFNNTAVSGYDAVSYFQDSGPVEGKKDFSTEYEGATWLFSSQENLDIFKAEPTKYAPQYGGYCAYAVGVGSTAKGDPLQWYIEDDKLYLNINKSIRKKWLDDIDNYIKTGDENWPKVLN